MLYADFEKQLDLFTLKVHIEAEKGIFSLFGASGSGKSMTLKCLAGIERPDRGVIRLGSGRKCGISATCFRNMPCFPI